MNTHLLNLAYEKPKIIEDKRREFVSYGEDNQYFQYIIDRYTNSTTNGAALDAKCRLVFGKGLRALDASKKIEDFALFQSVCPDEELKKVATDRLILGMGAFLVTREGGGLKLSHAPANLLRAQKDEDMTGEIPGWFYHPTWKGQIRKDSLTYFPAYKQGDSAKESMLVIKPYVTGYFYYSPISYMGALPYAVMEEEIADFLVNDVQTGFSGTKVINFNNGTPTPEEQRLTVKKVQDNLTGANGLKTIVAFNDDETKKTTVDDIPLNDAPSHYQYLAEECEAKILKGHKVPSVLLGFNSDNAGLSNNAEELKNKMIALDNYEIKPYQHEIIAALKPVLSELDISLQLYFKNIEPLEFGGQTQEIEEREQLSLSAQDELREFISKGEDIGEDWEVIDERDVDYDLEEDFDKQVSEWEQEESPTEKLSWVKRMLRIGSGTATPNSRSAQDKKIGEYYYKVRYKYHGNPSPEREFCKVMMGAGKLYRKEDIVALEKRKINPGWGPYGTDNYSIWKYKGGGSCKHRWRRVTFRNKKNAVKGAETIGTREAEIRGYKIRNDWEVSVPPNQMPNAGFVQPNKGKG